MRTPVALVSAKGDPLETVKEVGCAGCGHLPVSRLQGVRARTQGPRVSTCFVQPRPILRHRQPTQPAHTACPPPPAPRPGDGCSAGAGGQVRVVAHGRHDGAPRCVATLGYAVGLDAARRCVAHTRKQRPLPRSSLAIVFGPAFNGWGAGSRHDRLRVSPSSSHDNLPTPAPPSQRTPASTASARRAETSRTRPCAGAWPRRCSCWRASTLPTWRDRLRGPLTVVFAGCCLVQRNLLTCLLVTPCVNYSPGPQGRALASKRHGLSASVGQGLPVRTQVSHSRPGPQIRAGKPSAMTFLYGLASCATGTGGGVLLQ